MGKKIDEREVELITFKLQRAVSGMSVEACEQCGDGFDGIFMTCPYCFKMFDGRQRAIGIAIGDRFLGVPVFFYTQLPGLALGIAPEKLGLDLNMSPVDGIIEMIVGGSS
jgi:heterodisulfide reductase subunit B